MKRDGKVTLPSLYFLDPIIIIYYYAKCKIMRQVKISSKTLIYGEKERTYIKEMSLKTTLSHIQQYGKVKYQPVEKPIFNKEQQRLYAEVIYGLTIFKPEEISKLSPKRKYEIVTTFKKSQKILNEWKQEIINFKVNGFLSKLFPKSKVVIDLVNINGYEETIKCKHSFKELGLTQEVIAKKLVQCGILPPNFFQLGLCNQN